MYHSLSDKKNFSLKGYVSENKSVRIDLFLKKYANLFIVYRRNNIDKASSYLKGLMKCEKSHTNMERMVEQVPEQAYHQYHQFLSESKWDYKAVNKQTASEASSVMEKCKSVSNKPTGFIIDESSFKKKGTESVGVSRQYLGSIGKQDNGQVAVFASLCNEGNVTIIDTELFIPQCWIDDPKRCDKAGIPDSERIFQTKPQQALSIIKRNVELGVQFDWIGGDGLYGHNSELTRGLDALNLFYVLDVHKDENIYLEEPAIFVPEKKGKRGRVPSKFSADKPAIRIDKYCEELQDNQWDSVKIRKTAKGWKRVFVHTVTVWHWNGSEEKSCKRTLVITKTEDKRPKIKYSFSSGEIKEYTEQEYAYFQCNRYWVERSFDDAKNELGLGGYQARKWNAWHHHQSLVFMACLYLLKVKIDQKPEYELMSTRDARIMIIAHLFSDQETITILHEQMLKRHKDRQRDIDRYYKNDKS